MSKKENTQHVRLDNEARAILHSYRLRLMERTGAIKPPSFSEAIKCMVTNNAEITNKVENKSPAYKFSMYHAEMICKVYDYLNVNGISRDTIIAEKIGNVTPYEVYKILMDLEAAKLVEPVKMAFGRSTGYRVIKNTVI